MKRFGTKYGGFYYPENLDGLNQNSIIYCIGAGEDISHDIIIANQLKSKIHIFDPTPRSISHVNHVKNVLDGTKSPIYSNNIAGGDPVHYWKLILENSISSDNIIFKEYAVGIKEGVHKFYLPSNEDYVSCSLEEGMKSNDFINVNVRTLKTIMKELNHTHIDLLKMDIEGTECDVINNMLDLHIYPKYLAVEFDLAFNGEFKKDVEKCNQTIQKLYQHNYQLIHNHESDFTFQLISNQKTVITDIYSLGYRCNTDDLMKQMNIRNYSSPFSYMVIDYKSVFHYINTNFEKFFDIIYLDNKQKNNQIFELSNNTFYNYNWYNTLWYHDLYINKSCLNNRNIQNITDWNNVCIWNHHNLNESNIQTTLNRRIQRLYDSLDNRSSSTLLIYINKIENSVNYDINDLLDFTKSKNCNLLFIQPLYNFIDVIKHVYSKNNLNIIHIKSFYECNGTGLDDNRIEWDKIKNKINDLYDFQNIV